MLVQEKATEKEISTSTKHQKENQRTFRGEEGLSSTRYEAIKLQFLEELQTGGRRRKNFQG